MHSENGHCYLFREGPGPIPYNIPILFLTFAFSLTTSTVSFAIKQQLNEMGHVIVSIFKRNLTKTFITAEHIGT